jgi:hypothetical protein
MARHNCDQSIEPGLLVKTYGFRLSPFGAGAFNCNADLPGQLPARINDAEGLMAPLD